jgi:hypothetical protein
LAPVHVMNPSTFIYLTTLVSLKFCFGIGRCNLLPVLRSAHRKIQLLGVEAKRIEWLLLEATLCLTQTISISSSIIWVFLVFPFRMIVLFLKMRLICNIFDLDLLSRKVWQSIHILSILRVILCTWTDKLLIRTIAFVVLALKWV